MAKKSPPKNRRVPIPQAVQTQVLLATRHACCVCQAGGVQLHHIDGNPANNDPDNLAALCLPHHDQASMVLGLTKKIQPEQVQAYKLQWEAQCARDIMALSRMRFTFYYCVYKNPPRIKEALYGLSLAQRQSAASSVSRRLAAEQAPKTADFWFGGNAVPQVDKPTGYAFASIASGENSPGYLGKFKPHPADPDYSADCSTQEAMSAYHLYDLWCQIAVQILAEVRGTRPLEDLFQFTTEEDLDPFVGTLVSFKLSVRGKGIHIPKRWEEFPTGQIEARRVVSDRVYRVRMQLRTMYLFSDTAAENLRMGRVSGVGLFNGAVENDDGELALTVVPLLIGSGGWLLYPEGSPEPYAKEFMDGVRSEAV